MSSTNREPLLSAELLRPSRYDRAASLLISTLILSGTSVAVLVALWLGTHRDMPKASIDVKPGGAAGDKNATELAELEMPLLAELPQIAITEPIVELSTLLSRESVAAASTIDIGGPLEQSRTPGPPLPPEEVPRWERWEIRYDASSIKSYAKQLDFFQIELGAAGGKKHVDYASRLSDASPTTRSAQGDTEKRLYFAWRGGTLQAMDRKLLRQAGIDVENRIVLQFYSQEVEDSLARLEKEHAKDGCVDKLHKTIFGVRRSKDKYEFFIIEQR